MEALFATLKHQVIFNHFFYLENLNELTYKLRGEQYKIFVHLIWT